MKNTLSIVLPTRNEEGSIAELVQLIWRAKLPLKYELVVVDDSTDRTAEIAKGVGARVVKGQGKGLGQAIIDGIEASTGDIVVVMDADGQHSPSAIQSLLKPILEEGADMVVGSRYIKGGGDADWSTIRRFGSKLACFLALPITLFDIKDTTSGFFAFRKLILDNIKLKPSSWKIMLEMYVKANLTKVVEVPICFENRMVGKSKFNLRQMFIYFKHLILLAYYKYPIVKFGIVGLMGAVVHFSILIVLTEGFGVWYIWSTVAAVLLATTFNYTLNHLWTFKGRKNPNLVKGWLKYEVIDEGMDALLIGQLALFVEIFGIWYIAATVLAALVNYPIRYSLCKKFIWESKIKKNPSDADYDWVGFYRGGVGQKWWKHSVAKIVWGFIPNASSLLDIGCGSSPIISKYPGATGVDTNEAKITFMRNKLGNQGPGTNQARFAVMDARSVAFPDESFDHVLCIEVLEHFSHPDEVISEISRVLKVGGHAVIATPDYSRKLWLLAEKFTPARKGHIMQYNRKRLELECKMNSLVPVKHSYVAGCDLVELFEKKG